MNINKLSEVDIHSKFICNNCGVIAFNAGLGQVGVALFNSSGECSAETYFDIADPALKERFMDLVECNF